MGLSEDVLRFMNITVDEVPEEPSIMMNNAKPERGGRVDRSSSGRNVEAHDETSDDESDAAEESTSEDDIEE